MPPGYQEQTNQMRGRGWALPCPPQPLPDPLRGSETDSFAYFTVTERLPVIVEQVIGHNPLPAAYVANLRVLVSEIPVGSIRPLSQDGGPDLNEWAEYTAPYLGQGWLDVPWYFAEAYFYRRLLEATGYYSSGSGHGLDPFQFQKQTGLEQASESICFLSKEINLMVGEGKQWNLTAFEMLAYYELWGNRLDLSQKPADQKWRHVQSQSDLHQEQANILVDDIPAVAARVAGRHGARVDLVVDNAAFELFCDLAMADFLLTSRAAETVCLHLKSHPTFVSDATISDVHHTLGVLASYEDRDVRTVTERLRTYRDSGRLQLHADPFWTTPLAFWEMPAQVCDDLAQADLVFIKGDANYRRLLGDLHWPFTVPLADIACYFPAPFVALRTLKSELVVGLQTGQAETIAAEDANWLTNGRWGVIQFVDTVSAGEHSDETEA